VEVEPLATQVGDAGVLRAVDEEEVEEVERRRGREERGKLSSRLKRGRKLQTRFVKKDL
jgi:hypothetical protein